MTTTTSKWAGMPMLAFDTETSGVDTLTDRIVTAALVRIDPGHRPVVTKFVCDPGIDIPAEATAVHGYTRARAASEATHTPEQLLFEVAGALALAMGRGVPVVGFNVSYDLTLFEAECHRHGVDSLTARLGSGRLQPVVDVHVLDKHADPYRKGGRKLEQVCGHYGVRHTGAHDSAGDALAAARLWPRVMAAKQRGRAVFGSSLTLGQLHQLQVKARREQMDSLRAYFDRRGTEHDGCDGGWPLQQRLAGALIGGVQ